MLSHFSRVQLFETLWTIAHQTLLFMDSPGKNTGVDGHAFLQGIFLTQGSNPRLYVSCTGRWVFFFYRERHLGNPIVKVLTSKTPCLKNKQIMKWNVFQMKTSYITISSDFFLLDSFRESSILAEGLWLTCFYSRKQFSPFSNPDPINVRSPSDP